MANDNFVLGDYNALCDECGFKYKASQLKLRWDGLRVCEKDFEHRHPHDFIRARYDDQSVPWTRPEPDWNFLEDNEVTADDL